MTALRCATGAFLLFTALACAGGGSSSTPPDPVPPTEPFVCETGKPPETEAARDAAISQRFVEDGYLLVKTSGGPSLQMALYRDRTNQRNVVGLVKNDGAGSMCNVVQFSVWDDAARSWSEVDVLPRKELDAKAGNGEPWWPRLPKKSTATDVVDAKGKTIATLKWEGDRFVLP